MMQILLVSGISMPVRLVLSIVTSPGCNRDPRLCQAGEPMLIQTFIPEFAIIALEMALQINALMGSTSSKPMVVPMAVATIMIA